MSYLRKRRNAFNYAIKGLVSSVRNESHMPIHLGAALMVLCAAFYFGIGAWQWVALLACICLVLMAELFNSAAERICDLISTEQRADIAYIKDICAGAVLLTCLLAVITGAIIFFPYLFG